jgi:O-antigen/teichoic acid export membrane protein
MLYKGNLPFTTKVSRVSKKFFRKILTMVAFVWGGSLVFSISQVFDSLIIGAVMEDGLAFVAVYTLAQNISSLVQAPQRAIVSTSIAPLAEAWKNKDYPRINLIYHRSSINLLLFSVGMFILIWLNFTDGVLTFHLKKTFLDAQYVFFFIGLMRIIDLGSGVNSQIIGTSTFWRFDFITGMILLILTLPLNYVLTKHMGIIGPSIANLGALIIYNGIRYIFLLRKFNMQPFTIKTLYVLLLGLTAYFVVHILFHQYQGFGWIVLRSITFMAIYGTGAIMLKLSPDILPVLDTLKKKILRK